MKTIGFALGLLICCSTAQAVQCNSVGIKADNNCGSPHTPPPTPAPTTLPAPAHGTTVATIAANYPSYMEWLFLKYQSQMDTQITSLTDSEMQIMAQAYVSAGGSIAAIHQLAAMYLGVPNLVRWQKAFGQPPVNAAVSTYSAGTKSVAYFAHPALAAVKAAPGANWPPPNPNLNMTIAEVWAEYRYQPGATWQSAAYSTLKYLSPLAAAWGWGYKVGTEFYKMALSIDPDYGYDLVTTYGTINSSDFDTTVEFEPPATPSGQGFVENDDGTYMDGFGNTINLAAQPWYWFSDGCLFGLDCW